MGTMVCLTSIKAHPAYSFQNFTTRFPSRAVLLSLTRLELTYGQNAINVTFIVELALLAFNLTFNINLTNLTCQVSICVIFLRNEQCSKSTIITIKCLLPHLLPVKR